jgi:hypothetical protein
MDMTPLAVAYAWIDAANRQDADNAKLEPVLRPVRQRREAPSTPQAC